MDYKKFILNFLLDKYEESRHYKGDARVNRKVTMPFNKKCFPQYDIESTEIKDSIHYALGRLESRDIISIEWVKFEVGNIVDKVYLRLEKIDDAYAEAERKPKSDVVADTIDNLLEFKNTINLKWMLDFIDEQIKEIMEKKNLTKYIPRDQSLLKLLLDALKGIDEKGQEEMLERVFSKRYLGDSKIFENRVRSRLCTILREFCLKDANAGDEEALQEVGIIKTMEELLFFGPLKIKLSGSIIDFASFCFGASMNTEMIKSFEIIDLGVTRVITIENKANYIEYIKKKEFENTLVVYLGGFYSPVKRIFIKKIYEHMKLKGTKVQYYHWGDIDLGGFTIFMQLKSKLINELMPLYMDKDTLGRFADSGEKFDKEYGKKLQKLLENKDYALFHDCIAEMLKTGIKLEQEALL